MKRGGKFCGRLAAGLRFKLRPFAARVEYERFTAAGGTPYAVSRGGTWSF